jgi:hypothetical protein
MINRLATRDDQVGRPSLRIRMIKISTEHFRAILMFSQAERQLFYVSKYGSNRPVAAEVSYFHAADYFPVPTSRPNPSQIDLRMLLSYRISLRRKSPLRDQKLILSHALALLAVMNRFTLSLGRHASASAITWIRLTGSNSWAHAVRFWWRQWARIKHSRIQTFRRYP